MKENPILGKQAKLLTVRVKSLEAEEQGSGIIYLPQNNTEKIYIITAKHCLCGEKFTIENPKIEEIEIEYFNDKEQGYKPYRLTQNDKLLYFEENNKDIALLIIDAKPFEKILPSLHTFKLIDDGKGIYNSTLFGFPKGSSDDDLERVDTILQLPTNDFIWKADPQRTFQSEKCHLTLDYTKGFSGSGFFLNTRNDFLLFGIVTDFIDLNRFKGVKISLINDLLVKNDYSAEPLQNIEVNEEIIKGIQFLQDNSEDIRKNIQRKSFLGKSPKVSLDRTDLINKAIEKVNNFKVTIINGHAGHGKSVIAEKTLDKLEKEYTVFAIKAEELVRKNMNQLIRSNSSRAKFTEILDSPLLLENKILLIDSTEKLLETQELDGIEDLLESVNEREDLKIIFTIRDYALGSLLSLPTNYSSIEVPTISKEELEEVIEYYPTLNSLYENKKLKQLLEIPFYLNYTLQILPSLVQEENLDERGLKRELWKKVIQKSSQSRANAFEKLALKRANEMQFYVGLDNVADNILQSLITDEIILQNEDNYGNLTYVPAHDIFEDWSLVRYIQKTKNEHENLEDFYNAIGNAHAIRRGFRFWLQEELTNTNPTSFFDDFIVESLYHTNIKQYWKDEILIAILLSKHGASFLTSNKSKVLENNGQLFVRLIHLLRVACRKPFKSILENQEQNHDIKLYSFNFEPIGESWEAIISFIHQNSDVVEKYTILVLKLLLDWEGKLRYNEQLPKEARQVGEILLKIFRQEDSQPYYNYRRRNRNTVGKGLELFLRLTEVMKEEVDAILTESLIIYKNRELEYKNRRAKDDLWSSISRQSDINKKILFNTTEKEDKPKGIFSWIKNLFNFRLSSSVEDSNVLQNEAEQSFNKDEEEIDEFVEYKSENIIADKFYENFIELSLSCFETRELCIYSPDIVIQIAKEVWLSNNEYDSYHSPSINVERYFGISENSKMEYFPASAYQTPVYFLLLFHPQETLQFIVDIVNYTTEKYANSSFSKKNGLQKITIVLSTGKKVEKWGNITLWTTYRSLSIGTARPSLLKSMMMALEKWMLSLGASNQKEYHQFLNYAVNFLLEKSNSVLTTSVISSVSMAYPFILKETFLPIFTTRELFFLDRLRYISRTQVISPYIRGKQYIRDERYKSFKLKHRNESLEMFLLRLSHYQGFIVPIFKILDNHYATANKEDKPWLLTINRMDRRKINYQRNPDNDNSILLVPKIDEELKPFVEEGEKERLKDQPILSASNWVIEITSKNIQTNNTFINWQKFQKQSIKENQKEVGLLKHFKSNSAIAYIGLEYHHKEMNSSELKWCIETILETGKIVIGDTKSQDYLNLGAGAFDNESVIKGLALILKISSNKEANMITKSQIIQLLISWQMGDNLKRPHFEYLIESLWQCNATFAIQCFRVLYYYASLKKPRGYYHRSVETDIEFKKEVEKDHKALNQLIVNGINENLEEVTDFVVDFSNLEPYYFDKTFMFLPEKAPLTNELNLYREIYEKALVTSTYLTRSERQKYRDLDTKLLQNVQNFQKKYAHILAYQNDDFSRYALLKTIKYILEPHENTTHETVNLIRETFEYFIHIQHDIGIDKRFWFLWEIIYNESIRTNKFTFSSLLLFKTRIGGLHNFDWKPLYGKKQLLKNIITNFGKHNIEAAVDLLSHAGVKILLPEGIIWVKAILSEMDTTKINDVFYYERLVQRAFFIHRKQIQQNTTILKAYIWILDLLIEKGSSSSFYLREIALSRLN